MVERGVYTDVENGIIERTNSTQDRLAGWVKDVPQRVATEEAMIRTAIGKDRKNPFWTDPKYAAGTRWGGLIAIPLFSGGPGPHIVMEVIGGPNSDYGFHKQSTWWVGEDREFFKPIYAGDSFKFWRRPHHVEDITPLDGKGPRTFRLISHDFDQINQRGELVGTFKNYLQPTYIPEPPDKPYTNMPPYEYSEEQLASIDRIEEQEEIRGANIRYWEDVNVGDKIKPVIKGPINQQATVTSMAGVGGGLPTKEYAKIWPWEIIKDPVTGTIHDAVEIHFSDRIAKLRGFPCVILVGGQGSGEMVRAITNWMGDDAFMRRFNWRYLADTAVCDTLISRGKVVNKRVENNEYLVDLQVWAENIRGFIYTAAVSTVSLVSKNEPYPPKN